MPAIAQYTLLQALIIVVVVAEHIGVMVAFQQYQGAARHRVADAARKWPRSVAVAMLSPPPHSR